MCRLQTIKSDRYLFTMNVKKKAFLMSTNKLVRSIARWIERLVDSIVVNKQVSACRKSGWYMLYCAKLAVSMHSLC